MIGHGNAGEFGKYAIIPDKMAGFLYEYHHTAYASLQLPPIPLDQSGINVHGILLRHQVTDFFQYGDRDSACVWRICRICMLFILHAYYAYYAYLN
jgi:hypothetical protein